MAWRDSADCLMRVEGDVQWWASSDFISSESVITGTLIISSRWGPLARHVVSRYPGLVYQNFSKDNFSHCHPIDPADLFWRTASESRARRAGAAIRIYLSFLRSYFVLKFLFTSFTIISSLTSVPASPYPQNFYLFSHPFSVIQVAVLRLLANGFFGYWII